LPAAAGLWLGCSGWGPLVRPFSPPGFRLGQRLGQGRGWLKVGQGTGVWVGEFGDDRAVWVGKAGGTQARVGFGSAFLIIRDQTGALRDMDTDRNN